VSGTYSKAAEEFKTNSSEWINLPEMILGLRYANGAAFLEGVYLGD